uniref:Uncharacterized protein n=1 Tax=Rhizophora mucronata TaxID=61149 RepID=A0A2P2IH62_RHIMU
MKEYSLYWISNALVFSANIVFLD